METNASELPPGENAGDAKEAVVQITAELMLEVARACRDLEGALSVVEVDGVDPSTLEHCARQMRRIRLLFRTLPSILDPRRIVCFGDRCANNPDWWKANRLHYFRPDLTHRQIAGMLGLKARHVRDYIEHVEIPENCYDDIPYDDETPYGQED